jgi:uncharacterized membrane protein YgaE (UPF0421/DUF939 family)
MAGNTQMNENERGLFSFIHGITGLLVTVGILLAILFVLVSCSIKVQQENATNFYEIDQDLRGIKTQSSENIHYRINK